VSNTQTREDLQRLVEEQAALRRVATLVAQAMPSEALFSAVCDEVEALAGADGSAVLRFEADGMGTVMGSHGGHHPVGTRVELDPDFVVGEVHRTGRPARFDTDDPAPPDMPEVVRAARILSAVANPILVEGELWGAITTASRERPLAAGMDRRLTDFTELVATAVSNLKARTEVAASRARIAAAADDERRRVVRDLHDGAQQRLVHTVITLQLAQQALAKGIENAPLLLGEALEHAEQAIAEVRELAHGILPAVLTHGGLPAGIDALASRAPVRVEIDVSVGRLPAPIEATV
jgi:signal transduction histidine kinase